MIKRQTQRLEYRKVHKDEYRLFKKKIDKFIGEKKVKECLIDGQ